MDDQTILLNVDLSAYIKSLNDMAEAYKVTTDKIKALNDENAKMLAKNKENAADIEKLNKLEGDHSAEIDKLNAEIAENNDKIAKNNDELRQQNQLKKVQAQEIRGVEKEMQNEIKQHKAEEGSLVALRAQLSNLNKQYDSMSGMERMSIRGEELRKKIETLNANILSLEGSTGRWQRNVGNYQSALQGLAQGFNAAGISCAGLNKTMGLLNVTTMDFDAILQGLKANPLFLALTGIIMLFRSLAKAFKDNEAATRGLKEAVAAFNPILDKAKRGLEGFAKVIVTVVHGAVYGLTRAIGGLLTAVQAVGNFFGADWHMADNYIAARDAAEQLTKAENDYIDAKRNFEVESARIDRDVANLREKAADKEKYTAKERIKFLDEAIKLETKKAYSQKKLAQQNLDNLRKEAERSQNSAEMNDRLAQAERDVIEADKNLADTKRTLNKERQRAVNEINGVTEATEMHTKAVKEDTKAVEDNTDELERQAKEYHDKTISEMQKAEDALNDIILDAFEKRRAIEETAYQRKKATLTAELEAEKAAHGEGTALALAYNTQLEALEEQHALNILAIKADEAAREEAINKQKKDNDEKLAEEKRAIEKANLEYSAQIAGSLSDLMESVAGENEEMVKASKVIALAEVAIKQGVAIAEAVANAAAGDPYTYALRVAAAVASTVAAMASAIASINKASFETGGVIGGYRGATMGKDNTYIHARQGEMVLNAGQQRQLFEIANGGGSGVNMAAELAAAIQAMPAPVLDYAEFTRFQKRVATLSENSKMK